MAEHPSHREGDDWIEVGQFDLPSGQRVVVETRTETLSDSGYSSEDISPERNKIKKALLILANASATITYLSLCMIGLHRIFAEQNSSGFKFAMVLGILFFLWATAICWFGTSAIISNEEDSDMRLVVLIRAAGVVAMIPVVFFARAII